mgnify:CR=1 FL=1
MVGCTYGNSVTCGLCVRLSSVKMTARPQSRHTLMFHPSPSDQTFCPILWLHQKARQARLIALNMCFSLNTMLTNTQRYLLI